MTTQTTRRAALVGAAVLPAMSLPAIAGIDPVFAAVERFDACEAELSRICKAEPLGADGKVARDTPEYDAWAEEQATANHEWGDAEDVVFTTVPTTAAGALALLKCYIRDRGWEAEDGHLLLDSLIAYLERAAVRS
jgi:hypothetical protein